MEKNDQVKVVSQERLPLMMENFCKESQPQPLAVFYSPYGNGNWPMCVIGEMADRVFGLGSIKVLTFRDNMLDDMNRQAAILKTLPHQLIVIGCSPRTDGYDYALLFAEQIVKQTGKHVVVMIADSNSFTDESIGSRKLYYLDPATETLLSWRGRVKVWVADSPCGYGQTRQAYLACLKAGVLDMIKAWSEAGRMDDIRKVLDNADRLNETYRQYVCAREDLPYIVKYADFDERLMVQTDDTEFGRVTCLKAVNLEDIGGAARRCVSAPWRRVTRELKLVDG